jgi:hypothetical protein
LRFDVTRQDADVLLAELRGYAVAWWFPFVFDELLAAVTRLDVGQNTTATLEVPDEAGKAFHRWVGYAALRTRHDPPRAAALDRIHRSKR